MACDPLWPTKPGMRTCTSISMIVTVLLRGHGVIRVLLYGFARRSGGVYRGGSLTVHGPYHPMECMTSIWLTIRRVYIPVLPTKRASMSRRGSNAFGTFCVRFAA